MGLILAVEGGDGGDTRVEDHAAGYEKPRPDDRDRRRYIQERLGAKPQALPERYREHYQEYSEQYVHDKFHGVHAALVGYEHCSFLQRFNLARVIHHQEEKGHGRQICGREVQGGESACLRQVLHVSSPVSI